MHSGVHEAMEVCPEERTSVMGAASDSKGT